jgi:hypothetical protein
VIVPYSRVNTSSVPVDVDIVGEQTVPTHVLVVGRLLGVNVSSSSGNGSVPVVTVVTTVVAVAVVAVVAVG